MLATEFIPMRAASMQKSFRPAALNCFPIIVMKLHDAWKSPILKLIKFFSCILFGSAIIKRALQCMACSKTKSTYVLLNASASAFTWSSTSYAVLIFVGENSEDLLLAKIHIKSSFLEFT